MQHREEEEEEELNELVRGGTLGAALVSRVRAMLGQTPGTADRWTLVYALQRTRGRLTNFHLPDPDADQDPAYLRSWAAALVLCLLDVRPDLAGEPVMVHIAARYQCDETVFVRLAGLYPQNVSAPVYEGHSTGLHTAVSLCSWPVIEILLAAVPDIRLVPNLPRGGGTVFHRLCERGDPDLFVRFLRSTGTGTTDPAFLEADALGVLPWERVRPNSELARHLPCLNPSRQEALWILEAVAEHLLPDVADIVVGLMSMARHERLVDGLSPHPFS